MQYDRRIRSCGRRQRGLSLVELMVAILIGLIVLAGVVQVVLTSKSTFLGQEEMSYIQENARYAMDVIGRDVQNAGYWGCVGPTGAVAAVATAAPDDPAVEPGILLGAPTQPIFGYEADIDLPALFSGQVRQVPGVGPGSAAQDTPDSLIVRRVSGTEHPVQTDTLSSFVLTETSSYGDGRFLAVIAEDCQRMGIFRAVTVENDTVNYAGGVCTESALRPVPGSGLTSCAEPGSAPRQAYRAGSTVVGYSANAYFVGESPIVRGQPALMRASLSRGGAVIEEIALGVEDMELLYGYDNTNDQQPDQYLRADQIAGNDWNNVISVQVNLLFRSQAPSLPEPAEKEHLENLYNDRFVRQVVSSTFRLRNRF